MTSAREPSLSDFPKILARRRTGDYTVDLWGADSDWVDMLGALTMPFVRVRIDGAEHLPLDGGAVLVANRRLGLGEPLAVSVGIRRATQRLVRPVGAPDLSYIGPVLRRFGMVRAAADEVRSVVASGEMVVVALSPERRRRAGTVAPDLLAPALDLGVPVLPVAVIGGELTGSWRVHIGGPLPAPSTTRRTPLAAAELADRARAGVQMLLDDVFPV